MGQFTFGLFRRLKFNFLKPNGPNGNKNVANNNNNNDDNVENESNHSEEISISESFLVIEDESIVEENETDISLVSEFSFTLEEDKEDTNHEVVIFLLCL